MILRYDPKTDAARIVLADARIDESEEISPGIVLDFDFDGRIVGIEILIASTRLPASALTTEAA
jgi:uncharacterized protein YuzE